MGNSRGLIIPIHHIWLVRCWSPGMQAELMHLHLGFSFLLEVTTGGQVPDWMGSHES